MAITAVGDERLGSIPENVRLEFLERIFDDAQGACDRVVGRPDISPFPNNGLFVANRMFDTIIADLDELDPMPAGTDLQEVILADGMESGD